MSCILRKMQYNLKYNLNVSKYIKFHCANRSIHIHIPIHTVLFKIYGLIHLVFLLLNYITEIMFLRYYRKPRIF